VAPALANRYRQGLPADRALVVFLRQRVILAEGLVDRSQLDVGCLYAEAPSGLARKEGLRVARASIGRSRRLFLLSGSAPQPTLAVCATP
jgi:hypothetical protein